MPERKQGKKGRQIGRNKDKCAYYRLHRAYANKVRKLKKHLAHHPLDWTAINALTRATRSA